MRHDDSAVTQEARATGWPTTLGGRRTLDVLLIVYIGAVCWLTFGPPPALPHLGPPTLLERLANVALFVPGGALIALRTRWRALRIVVVLAAWSAAIELTQLTLATWRTPDVGDVIMNTTGALVGVALVSAYRRARPS